MTIEQLKDKYNLALDNIAFPVHGDEYGHIFDRENNHVLDIRGWGRIQYMDNCEEIMMDMEGLLVDLLNGLADGVERAE